ncbi:xanthine dehydrogenase/oxidase-like [Saccoglossus kowalevskii]
MTCLPGMLSAQTVTHCGQIIGAIIAENREIARHAAKRVVVEYEDLKPILTIEDAIEAESYFDMLKLVDGDVSKGFTSCDHIIEGEVMLGGQEHYYLETHISQVIPDNGDQTMVVLSSTQNPSSVQSSVADVLGFHCNKIITKLTRIGGGFGGKETRSDMFACICAVAAHRAKQPMRLVLEREDDMKISGGRHPYLARYKVGCTKNGKLLALDVQLYSNGGHSLDMTPYVMQYALLAIPNCYIIPNVRLQGFMCKTNLPSNTSMRGFGCPQAVFITEHIVTDIAIKCNISQQKFRKTNFIGKDFVTHYGQIVENCNARRCFDECVEKSRFHVKQDQIQTFNRENRFVKKGISVTPVIMAVGFHCKLLNQAGALVQVYRDGSVLLTHGGVEMGQGLYIKMIQIASTVLDIPMDYIHTADTSTQTVPNTSPTAASVGTHINGCAVKRACEKIIERLRILKENDPEGDWNKWIEGAFLQGYGLYMSEELMWSEKGELIHSGLGMYKLPHVCNIPRKFNIELLSDSESSKHVYSSRGVGEPPLVLACSVFFATKEAIAAARRDIGLSEQFRMDSPAIPRRVLIVCGDQHK